MKKFWRQLALRFGYYVAPTVANEQVLQLIRSLRPQECGKPLIRVGAANDGGYLVPDDLTDIEYCFSPGVNDVAEFETALAKRNTRSFMADYSVNGPPQLLPQFVFDKKFVGSDDNETHMTLASWKQRYLPSYQRDLILQMDIEGSEYEVILSTPTELLRNFRIIVLELHQLDALFDPFAHSIMKACFDKLLATFYVVHSHPNNCAGSIRRGDILIPQVMEITFYNRARAAPGAYVQQFPHPLDADCCSGMPPLPLPSIWYRAG